jgi:hypothetical protein
MNTLFHALLPLLMSMSLSTSAGPAKGSCCDVPCCPPPCCIVCPPDCCDEPCCDEPCCDLPCCTVTLPPAGCGAGGCR